MWIEAKIWPAKTFPSQIEGHSFGAELLLAAKSKPPSVMSKTCSPKPEIFYCLMFDTVYHLNSVTPILDPLALLHCIQSQRRYRFSVRSFVNPNFSLILHRDPYWLYFSVRSFVNARPTCQSQRRYRFATISIFWLGSNLHLILDQSMFMPRECSWPNFGLAQWRHERNIY